MGNFFKDVMLGCLVAIGIMACALPAAAQSARTLSVNNPATIYNLAPYASVYKAHDDTLSVQKVLSLHKAQNIHPSSADRVFLGYTSKPSWIVFTVENQNTIKTRWMLDLGWHGQGTVGVPERVALFSEDNPDTPLLIDGRAVRNKLQMEGQEKNALPLILPPMQTKTFALYIEPARGSAVVLTPKVEELTNFEQVSNTTGYINKALAIIAAVFVVMFALFSINGKVMIPGLLAAYTSLGWMIYKSLDEIAPQGNNTLVVYIDILYALSALAALALTWRIFFAEEEESSAASHFILPAVVVVTLLAVLGLAVDGAGKYTTIFFLRVLPVALPAFITALGVMALLKQGPSQTLMYTISWVLLLVGALVTESTFSGFAAPTALNVNFYWISFLAHLAFLSFASIYFIATNEARRRKREAEEALRLEEETEFRRTREMTDQSKLLGVMQREKELIADLRSREAERVQAMRQAKDIAEKADKAKSEFLAIISHEIRTPLTGIMGMIRLLMDTPLNPKQKEHVSTLEYAGDALLGLLNDILDYSKAAAGKIELENVNFDIVKLTESVVTLISGRAVERKIFLKSQIEPNTPTTLRGDPTRLRQVLLNLVANAVKFTETGGVTLIVKAHNLKGEKKQIYFAVQDTGIGISEDAQKVIFTPYSQANSSITRRFGGTGLGLSICLRLVSAMGGEIKVDSKMGSGTRFHFILPFDEPLVERLPEVLEKAAEASAPPATAASTAKTVTGPSTAVAPSAPVKQAGPNGVAIPLNILVIDDNEINQKVVDGFLARDKHKLTPVLNAREGIDRLLNQPFDVILMDMEMPGMDGITATKQIRALENKEKADIPIIAMTANSSKEDVSRCILAGMNDYCAKPIDLEKLRALLNDVAVKSGSFKPGVKHAPTETKAASVKPTNIPPKIPDGMFNTDQLGALKKTMGRAEMDGMLKELYDKTEELIAATERSMGEFDVKAIARRGHDIYGMTANFGLTALSELASRMNKQSKENNPPEVLSATVRQLRPTYEQTRVAITAWMEKE